MAWDYINVRIYSHGRSQEFTCVLSPAGLEKREARLIKNTPIGRMTLTGKDSYEELGPMGRNDYYGADDYLAEAGDVLSFVQKLVEEEGKLKDERERRQRNVLAFQSEPAQAFEGLGGIAE